MSEITPYVCVPDGRAAVAWYRDVLGAEVTVEPMVMDDGRVGHAEVTLGGARLMLSDEFESAGVAPPPAGRGAAVTLHLTVDDVDGLVERVIAAGTTPDRGPEDTPHGRIAVFTDPFGHRWMLNEGASA